MDIADIRRQNMLLLLQGYKTQAEFANLVGTDPAYISQLKKGIKKTGERVAMGDDLARNIENALDLPYGVMDRQNMIVNNSGMFIAGDNHGTQIQNNHNNSINNACKNDGRFIVSSMDMLPTFLQGDCLRIDANRKPQAGNFVLATYKGEQILRKYRPKYDSDGTSYVQLVASNEDYPVMDSRHQDFELIGVAVEFKRGLV